MPLLSLILPFLQSIVPDVVKRVLPAEKMSDEERAKLAQELTLAMMQADWQKVEAEYKDRQDARALAAAEIAKGNALTSFLAAIVRPLWGLGAFALIAYSVWMKAPIDDSLQAIVQTVLAFYFGGRVIEKVLPTVAGAIKR